MKERILAWVVLGAMVFGILPKNAFANEIGHTNSKKITQITVLSEEIETQEFTKGEENAAVNLPETILAQVKESTWTEVEIETPPSEDVATDSETDTPIEDVTDGEDVAKKSATSSDTPKTEWQSTTTVETVELAVTWAEVDEKEFSTSEVASFRYISAFSDATCTLAEGVEMPEITVNVVEKAKEETPFVLATSIEPQADDGVTNGLSDDEPISGDTGATSEYNVWVGGTQVTTENQADVLGDGTVSYTETDTEATLTLNGAEITTTYEIDSVNYSDSYSSGIYYKGEKGLTIVTASDSIINLNHVETINEYSSGIYAFAPSLTLTGSGKLSASGGDAKRSRGIYFYSSSGIRVIVDGIVECTGGNAQFSYGAECRSGFTVNENATFTAMGGASEGYSGFTVSRGISDSEKSIINGTVEAFGESGAFNAAKPTVASGLLVKAGNDKASATVVEDLTSNYQQNKYVKIQNPTQTEGTIVYNLLVGGRQVTSENQDNILGDGTVSYAETATTGTLTLNGANITSVYESDNEAVGIYYKGSKSLKINTISNSTIDLSAVTTDKASLYAIYSSDLLFDGSGTLEVTGGTATSGDSYGVFSNAFLTVNETANLKVTGGTATSGESHGLYANDSIVLYGTVEAVGGTASASYGVCSLTEITVGETAKLQATGGTAISGDSHGLFANESITLHGIVEAVGGTANRSCGACSLTEITVGETADFQATGGTATSGDSYGLYAGESIMLQGRLEAFGEGQALNRMPNIKKMSGVLKSGDDKNSATEIVDPTPDMNFHTDKYVALGTGFGLWVDGVQITSLNKDDVLGDGTVQYIREDNRHCTLVLNAAHITNVYEHNGLLAGMYLPGLCALTINVVSDSIVDLSAVERKSIYSTGIFAQCYYSAGVEFVGEGKLTVIGGNATERSSGIWSDRDTVINGTVEAIGGDAKLSCGVFVDADMYSAFKTENDIIVNGTLKAIGGIVTSGESYGGYVTNGNIRVNSTIESMGNTAAFNKKPSLKTYALFETKSGNSAASATVVADVENTEYHNDNYVKIDKFRDLIVYPIWVGGIIVTDLNQTDVLGDGTVSYTETETGATLTLNGANITDSYYEEEGNVKSSGIHYTGYKPLTIHTTNASTVDISGGTRTVDISHAIESINAALLFEGAGKLTAISGESYNTSFGVFTPSNITVNGTLEATGCNSSQTYGISTNGGKLTIGENATLKVTSSDASLGSGSFSVGTMEIYGTVEAVAGTAPNNNTRCYDDLVVHENGTFKSNGLCVTVSGDFIVQGNLEVTAGDKAFNKKPALQPPTDYKLVVKSGEDADSATVVADVENTAYHNDNYVKIQKKLLITPLADEMIAVDLADKTYTGSEIKPTVTITDGDMTLVEGTDFDVTYISNINAGTATIRITGKGDYSGTLAKTFKITPIAIEDSMIAVDLADKPYTGSAFEPEVTMTAGDTTLAEDTDFAVTYTSNTNGGTATIRITGKGNYSGTFIKTFKIVKVDQTSLTITSTAATYGEDLTLVTAGGSGDGDVTYTITNGTGEATILNGALTPTKVGEVTVTATKAGGNNYNDVSSTATTITIGKASQTGTAQELLVVKELAKEYTFDLSKMLPSLSDGRVYGNVNYSVRSVTDMNQLLGFAPTNANISNGTLTLNVASVATKDQTATVEINISSEHYTFERDVVLIIKTVDKTPVDITATMTSRTYDGTPLAYTDTPIFTDTSDHTAVTGIGYTVNYVGVDGTAYTQSETAPTNAGKYNLVLTVDDTSEYTGTQAIAFVITKADQTYTVPTGLTATYGDTLADVTLSNGFAFQEADTTLVGNAGDNIFKVTFTPTDTANYNMVNDIDVVVKVMKKVQALTFAGDVTAQIGDASATKPTLSGAMTVVEYASGNPAVATVDEATGEVAIIGVGTAIITATTTETEAYSLATATYKVTVNAGEISLASDAVTKFDAKYSDLEDVILTIGNTKHTLARSGNQLISTALYPFNDGEIGTVVEGSVVVTLYKEFLSTLPKGTTYSVAITAKTGGAASGGEVTGAIPATKDSYNLTITGGGTGATASSAHEMGSFVNINAGTKDGYTFSGWSGATFASANSGTTKMVMPSANTEITANWTKNGTGGSGGSGASSDDSSKTYYVDVQFGSGDGSYTAGEWVTISAEVREGKTFSHWVSNEVTFEDKNVSTTRFKMNSKDVTVTAVYVGEHANPQTSVKVEDVKSSDWLHDFVCNVVDKGLFADTADLSKLTDKE